MLRKTKQQIAHTSMMPALGNRDLRSLQELINSEKAFIKADSNSSTAWQTTTNALKAWSEGEGEDLADVLSKLSLLFGHYSAAHTRFDNHLSTLRLHFKSIRTREEGLADLKSRKRNLASKIESVERKLSKMGPENKELLKTTTQLKEHRAEMESLKIEVMTEEAAIGDFKRRTSKEAMGLKCGGMMELAEKLTIVAEVGKLMIDEISLEPTKPGLPRAEYQGHTRTDQLLSEATRSLADVGFAPSSGGPAAGGAGHRPDLSHYESNYGGPAGDDTYNSGMQHSRDSTGNYGTGAGAGGTYNRAGDDDAYDAYAGNNTYNAAADYSGTPIYASHQTTQPWLTSSADAGSQRGEAQPSATTAAGEGGPTPTGEQDDWARTADAAVSGAGAAVDGSHHSHGPEHEGNDRLADGLPDPSQPWRSSGLVGGPRSRTSSYQAAAGAPPRGPSTPPPNEQMQNMQLDSSSPAAPSLPPLRATTPLPGGGSGPPAMASGTPATPQQQQQALDDESYFASVGSTRAAQAAARRPTSPAAGNRYSAMMSNSASTNSLAAMGATAASQQNTGSTPGLGPAQEPTESGGGRKMTAAAFRKGFNRNPSANHQSMPSPATENAPSFSGGREGASSPAPGVAPLAIRKRHSAVPDEEVGDEEAVPPYAPGGAGGPAPSGPQQQNPYHQQPPQQAFPQPSFGPGQIYNGSRPGSSAGHGGQQQYQQQQQPYGAGYAAGPNY
ncbi:hypothetical protein BDZ90DRAFT_229564 [Jaminaea rosea]|uniref:Eisosome component PIL1-domain-containing protein n=1 Tax=Jaminaea rosea TaxID=1569628 RepID=A0A316V0M6_9BASI|nr:hypothetical protein BDZ90DRAFT_229564 [Jaminaea rosea]PWN30548.1 hypothetical protein BDZ90DRAFT_229564 [Jaminaea rosea]